MRAKVRQLGKTGAPVLTALPHMEIVSVHCRYHIDGGRDAFVRYVQYALLRESAPARAWWAIYDALSEDERAVVNFDDICLAAQIDVQAFMRDVVAAATAFGHDAAALIAASHHATVVHQTAKSAKRIGGEHAEVAQRDRRMLLDHAGFTPQKQGTVVNVNAHATAQAGAAAAVTGNGFGAEMAQLAQARQVVQGELKQATRALQAAFVDDDV